MIDPLDTLTAAERKVVMEKAKYCPGADGLACIDGYLYAMAGSLPFPANRTCPTCKKGTNTEPAPSRLLDTMSPRVLEPLIKEFGQKNVEETLIYIQRACDSKGLRVIIKTTPEMVRACLEAVHGRLGVNEVRI